MIDSTQAEIWAGDMSATVRNKFEPGVSRVLSLRMTGKIIDNSSHYEAIAQGRFNEEKAEELDFATVSLHSTATLPIAEVEPDPLREKENDFVAVTGIRITECDVDFRKNSDNRRPALIGIEIHKQSQNDDLGLEFKSIKGELQICNVSPCGPMADSPLRRGDRVIRLGRHQYTRNWTSSQAYRYIRAQPNVVSILVQSQYGDTNIVEACVCGRLQRSKIIGVSFCNGPNGRLIIDSFNENSFWNYMGVLQSGDFVESINSDWVGDMDAAMAQSLLKANSSLLSIRVKMMDIGDLSVRSLDSICERTPEFPEVPAHEPGSFDRDPPSFSGQERMEPAIRAGFLSANVFKVAVGIPAGIQFDVCPELGLLRIMRIDDNGLFGRSPLRTGQMVHSIHGADCRDWTPERAEGFVGEVEGDLRIVAHDPEGDVAYTRAESFKPTPRSRIGIIFEMARGRSLRIKSIASESILGDSVLNEGDYVVAINGIFCEGMRPRDATPIIRANPAKVCILSRTKKKTGIVLSSASPAAREGFDLESGQRENLGLVAKQEEETAGALCRKPQDLSNDSVCLFFAALAVLILVGGLMVPLAV